MNSPEEGQLQFGVMRDQVLGTTTIEEAPVGLYAEKDGCTELGNILQNFEAMLLVDAETLENKPIGDIIGRADVPGYVAARAERSEENSKLAEHLASEEARISRQAAAPDGSSHLVVEIGGI